MDLVKEKWGYQIKKEHRGDELDRMKNFNAGQAAKIVDLRKEIRKLKVELVEDLDKYRRI